MCGALLLRGCGRGGVVRLGVGDGAEIPFSGNAFECVAALVGEREAGPDNEVADGRGNDDLAGVREFGDA